MAWQRRVCGVGERRWNNAWPATIKKNDASPHSILFAEARAGGARLGRCTKRCDQKAWSCGRDPCEMAFPTVAAACRVTYGQVFTTHAAGRPQLNANCRLPGGKYL